MTTIPNDSIKSLHLCANRFNGVARSVKQRGWLVGQLSEFALSTRTMAEDVDGTWVPCAREYTVVDDRGVHWAFTSTRTEAWDAPFLTRARLGNDPTVRGARAVSTATPTADPVVVVEEPIVLGPVLDEALRAELRQILRWGPSEFVFTAPSPAVIAAMVEYAKMDLDGLDRSRSRRSDRHWSANDIGHITRVQIAAKGLLCEVSDHAGESTVSMSAADAEYISQMIVGGHLRNGCWFKRANMSEKRLRSATIVNKAKMDDATGALAQRMVDLMNAEMKRLGRPVKFDEYVAIMTDASAA